MSEQIKNISLKFSCPVNWERMADLNGAKYCDQCHKKVYDFTNANEQEFLKILAENGNNLCGRYHQAQMAPKFIIASKWKKWLSAAVVLVGINIFNNRAEAQNVKIKATDAKSKSMQPDIILGGISDSNETMPDFPGGLTAFASFLSKNIHYTKSMKSGRVFISFTVNKDGALNNFKIERGINLVNDNEAIRVLKLSPRWKPGTLNGKPTSLRYILPISFQK